MTSSDVGQDNGSDSSGVTRRTVVRTAGHAAWMAPVVIAATTVPAFAGSGPADLTQTVTAKAGTASGAQIITVISSIANANDQATQDLTVTMTVILGSALQWINPSATAPGYGAAVVSGTTATRTFVFTAAAQIPGNMAKDFNPVVTTGSLIAPTGTVSAQATVGGGGTAAPSNTATIM